jgi:PAS domain S-box-containing protein
MSSFNFYKEMLSNIHEGFIYAKMVYDKEGKAIDWVYEFVNKSYEKHTGKTTKEVLNNRASIVYGVEHFFFQKWLDRFDKISKENSAKNYEDYFAPSKKWLRVSAFCPKPGYFGATFTDISEVKDIYKALINQKNKFEMLYNTINTGIVYQDKLGEIIDCNPAAESILGLNYQQMTGLNSVDPTWKSIRVDGSDYPGEEHPPMLALKDKKKLENQLMGIFHPIKQAYSWISINSIPLLSENKLIGVVSTFIDVTEQHIAKIKLEDLNKKLEESNKNLEEFAYIASHDLKEPVRTVKSFVGILEKRLHDKLENKDEQIFKFITEGATRMENMIEDLLKFSRLNTSDFLTENLDISSIIDETTEVMAESISKNKVQIIYKDLVEIEGNKLMILRLFQNLFNNSIKYNTSVSPVITIESSVSKNFIRISISDNGIGIKEVDFEKIFKLFKRLHSNTQFEGSGIGLAICKKVMEKHNGQILVESVFEKGTTFHLDFPIK